MTVVYVDPARTLLEPSPPGPPGGQRSPPVLIPGALEAIRRLRDERYRVVVLARRPLAALRQLGDAISYAAEPAAEAASESPAHGGLPARAWLISADEAWGERARPPGLLTVRVGPRPGDVHRPTARFDVEARDLPAAVMEILVRDTLLPT